MADLLPHSGELYALLCALVFALAVVMFRKIGESVPPVALNLFKGVVALVLLLPTMALLGVPFVPPDASLADWGLLAASGVLGITVADTLFFASLNRLGASGSAIVDCLYSPLLILCAFVYLGEPIGAVLLLAMGLMVAAILVGTSQPARRDQPTDPTERRRGVAFGALSMLLMAVSVVMVKPVLDRSDVLWATTVRLGAATVFLTAQGLLPAHRRAVLCVFRPSRSWRITVPAAVIGTYVAMLLWIAGMKYANTSVAGVLNQTSTLFTPLLAALFLRERLTRRTAVAVAMGFSGAALLAL